MAFVPQTYSFEEILTSSKMNQVDSNIDEVRKAHKGSSAPASPVAGTDWIDDSVTPWLDQVYDGADWIVKGKIDAANNNYLSAGWALLRTQTLSAVASVDFTSDIDSTFDCYALVIKKIRPATDNSDLWLRVSDDAGSTFKSGASDYQYAIHGRRADGTEGPAASEAVAQIVLTNAEQVGNTTNEFFNGVLFMYHPANAEHTYFTWTAAFGDEATARLNLSVGAAKAALALTIDGIQLLFSSGNIAEGEVSLYGISE